MYICRPAGSVDTCPVTKKAWEARAELLKEECDFESDYHCLPDNEGVKWEKCIQKTLILEGNMLELRYFPFFCMHYILLSITINCHSQKNLIKLFMNEHQYILYFISQETAPCIQVMVILIGNLATFRTCLVQIVPMCQMRFINVSIFLSS